MSQRFRARTNSSYSAQDFNARLGQWISFQTPWGDYRGVVERVRNDAVLIKVPGEDARSGLAHHIQEENPDIVLAGGYPPYAHPYPKPYPWCWFWIPFAVIIVFVPWLWW